MSTMRKRVAELEDIVDRLVEESSIELHAGDEKTHREWFATTNEWHLVTRMVNKRSTSTKRVLLDLLRHLQITLRDDPPQKGTFTLVDLRDDAK